MVERVESADDWPRALSAWTAAYFGTRLKRPGVVRHPRALIRVRAAPDDPKPRMICPHSFPVGIDTRMALEQVSFDMSGMQPRLLREDRPWLEQPAIYTDCVLVVHSAKKVAQDWLDEARKKKAK